MTARPSQIELSHKMLDAMIHSKIALSDAGTGIGKTYAYLNFGTGRETRTLWPNSRSADIAQTDNPAYDLYRQNGAAFDTLDSAARYCIEQHGQTQVTAMVKGAGTDHEDMSRTLQSMLNEQGIVARWTVYSVSTKEATYFTVQWNSFGG